MVNADNRLSDGGAVSNAICPVTRLPFESDDRDVGHVGAGHVERHVG